MSKAWKRLEYNIIGDQRGSLVALETCKEIPFDIKRVYYIYENQKGLTRGMHAHKKLQQVLICLSGHCTVHLDDGENKESIELDFPHKAIYINRPAWREIDMSPGAVLVCLANESYSEEDYLRTREEFENYIKI
ncbi:MAG: FdtA/QdtA family cupin domain-containing protein [Bdellovibrionota bacterium]